MEKQKMQVWLKKVVAVLIAKHLVWKREKYSHVSSGQSTVFLKLYTFQDQVRIFYSFNDLNNQHTWWLYEMKL